MSKIAVVVDGITMVVTVKSIFSKANEKKLPVAKMMTDKTATRRRWSSISGARVAVERRQQCYDIGRVNALLCLYSYGKSVEVIVGTLRQKKEASMVSNKRRKALAQ